jgi:hypothetical protein
MMALQSKNERLLHYTADVGLLADIANERQPTPSLCLDLLNRAMHIVPIDGLFVRWKGRRVAPGARHDDIGTRGGQGHGRGPPNATQASGTCHHGHFTFQNSHKVLLCLGMSEGRLYVYFNGTRDHGKGASCCNSDVIANALAPNDPHGTQVRVQAGRESVNQP